MKKKKIILILIIIILMLIPIPTKLKDGTSTEYKALLYSITKYHIINQDSIKGYDDGFKIKILGITVYDNINTYLTAEHVINIRSNDKIIKAETGSFCYKSGECVDKIDFQDFNYDIISSFYENKLSIENLDGMIKSVELFDYQTKKYIDMTIKYTNDYIITPKVNGMYIFKINADYEGKDISYYFMSEIRKNK
ncbi:putative uncharacterized protein [Clostridium sp. CAG:533]|nr:putative uncharacterized protein [Clostridium sp. CAG:533]